MPAVVASGIFGEREADHLLILSQVVLSLQLGFALVPLIGFTSDKAKMGAFANGSLIRVAGWVITIVIIALNAKLLLDMLR